VRRRSRKCHVYVVPTIAIIWIILWAHLRLYPILLGEEVLQVGLDLLRTKISAPMRLNMPYELVNFRARELPLRAVSDV
jgi:hypothetical protein